jgi:hypothetical protein
MISRMVDLTLRLQERVAWTMEEEVAGWAKVFE